VARGYFPFASAKLLLLFYSAKFFGNFFVIFLIIRFSSLCSQHIFVA